MKILVNGAETNQLSVSDRGLQYGDGLFETMAVREQKASFLTRHLQRLQLGCERLQIPMPPRPLLIEEIQQLAQGQRLGVLKLIVTRGISARGYAIPETCQPTRIVMALPWPTIADDNGGGVKVRICETRLSTNPRLAGIKHLNRLEQVIARSEWQDLDIAEGLMLNAENEVIEGTMSNLFVVIHESLYTPPITTCGVAGVMRSVVVETARKLGLKLRIAPIRLDQLRSASEIFLTNAIMRIVPVRQVDSNRYTIGPISQRLIDAVPLDELNA